MDWTMDNGDILKSLICLECNSSLDHIKFNNYDGVFLCSNCRELYLITEGIFRILPREYLRRSIYDSFYVKYKKQFTEQALLDNCYWKLLKQIGDDNQKWEDEDVKHWDNVYATHEVRTERNISNSRHIAGNRLYQRKIYFIDTLLKEGIQDKIILEIGCGTAETISSLLPPDKNNYHYIATDYSIEALKYLRNRYPDCKNITFIQCLGNHLPIIDGSVDYLFSLGVLHHMPGKEKDIYHVFKKIKKGGLFLFHEGFYRGKKLCNHLINNWIQPVKSAHEERINKYNMLEILDRIGNVRLLRYDYSPGRTLFVKLIGRLMERSILITRCILIFDYLVINSVGKLFKSFGPGECYAIVEKR